MYIQGMRNFLKVQSHHFLHPPSESIFPFRLVRQCVHSWRVDSTKVRFTITRVRAKPVDWSNTTAQSCKLRAQSPPISVALWSQPTAFNSPPTTSNRHNHTQLVGLEILPRSYQFLRPSRNITIVLRSTISGCRDAQNSQTINHLFLFGYHSHNGIDVGRRAYPSVVMTATTGWNNRGR